MIEAGAFGKSKSCFSRVNRKGSRRTKKIIALIEDLVTKSDRRNMEVVEDPLLHELAALIEKS